jgi:ABC-type antimicrobial peptide transport system permease subunit
MATANSPSPAPPAPAPSKWRPVLGRFARLSLLVALSGALAGAVEGILIALFLGASNSLAVYTAIALDRALTLGLVGLAAGALAGLADALWRFRKQAP